MLPQEPHGAGFALLPFQCHSGSLGKQTGPCDSSTLRKSKNYRKIKAIDVTQGEAFVLFN